MFRLQRIDSLLLSDHFYLSDTDHCYFFGTYSPGEGYSFSEFNNFLLNFKKRPGERGQSYKKLAIDQAGKWIAQSFFPLIQGKYSSPIFVPVHPSKAVGHSGHDDRCHRALIEASKLTQGSLRAGSFLRQSQSTAPFHEQTSSRPDPTALADLYRVEDPQLQCRRSDLIVVFDDLLVTGAHFKAAAQKLSEHAPQSRLIGLFLGRRRPAP